MLASGLLNHVRFSLLVLSDSSHNRERQGSTRGKLLSTCSEDFFPHSLVERSYFYHRHMTKALFDRKTIYFSGTFIKIQIAKLSSRILTHFSQVSVYLWITFKSYNLNASWMSGNLVEVTRIEMATLCDLEGLPESPRLHLASSRTKLKKNEKTIMKKLNYTASDIALQKQSNSHGQMILTKSAPRQCLRPSTGQVVELRLCLRQL